MYGYAATNEDGFVALALRPKLPKWTDVKPRDQVIVVDTGRAMFGERFKRARRLGIQMVQEMDRRDRVTVLACDITCRAMPGGWKVPGSGAAHDVDAFMAGLTPDGASDLVGAVRAAGATGHTPERDLRVVLVSSGVASAGYRRLDRVATEVGAALPDTRAEVITVPVGADADTTLLQEIARGGGGVLVPYEPGERLEAAALDVLNATYGTTLRDVELTLPEGFHDAAPSVLAPIRAGEERIVLARVKGDRARGEVVLKGKVGGESFEAKYPIDARVTADAGNAFVPRLYASARVADKERDGGETYRPELVALSRRYAVPSRFTSLLVLESEAMFQAFGIDRAQRAPTWTGELEAKGSDVATLAAPSDDASGSGALGLLGGMSSIGSGGGGSGTRLGDVRAGPAAAAPLPKASMQLSEDEDAPRKSAAATRPMPPPAPTMAPPANSWRGRSRRDGLFMKRVFFRRASISQTASPAFANEKIAAARSALEAAPDERTKHRDLARLLAANGQLDELSDLLAKWSTRDPLDADGIAARADLLARQGDRDAALRVLGGALATPALGANDASLLASTIAAAHERAGKSEACAFRVTAAELRPADLEAIARAVLCERSLGRRASADRWMVGLKDDATRNSLSLATAKIEQAASKPETVTTGDFVVTATWDARADADLDLAIMDPSGARAAWASRARNVRVADATSKTRESLALSNGATGPFVVEVVRASGGTGLVSGTLTLRAIGAAETIAFTLPANATRLQVARVDVRMESELVPVSDPSEFVDAVITNAPPFDRGAAASVLSVAASSARSCGDLTGNSGEDTTGRVFVTFAPAGPLVTVRMGAPFAGTPVGNCVASRFRAIRIAPFSGENVTVSKTFTVTGP